MFWQFGLVVFNDEANTLEGCYGNQVVPVTSTTKKSFRDFLNSQQAQKGATMMPPSEKRLPYLREVLV